MGEADGFEEFSMLTRDMDVRVRRGEEGMGIVVSQDNILLELTPDGSAKEDGILRPGDVIIAIDGHPLNGRRLRDHMGQIPRRSVHLFTVRRSATEARPPSPGHESKHGSEQANTIPAGQDGTKEPRKEADAAGAEAEVAASKEVTQGDEKPVGLLFLLPNGSRQRTTTLLSQVRGHAPAPRSSNLWRMPS
eukprot:1770537-Pleurochrysis_carterae.AAC.3